MAVGKDEVDEIYPLPAELTSHFWPNCERRGLRCFWGGVAELLWILENLRSALASLSSYRLPPMAEF